MCYNFAQKCTFLKTKPIKIKILGIKSLFALIIKTKYASLPDNISGNYARMNGKFKEHFVTYYCLFLLVRETRYLEAELKKSQLIITD